MTSLQKMDGSGAMFDALAHCYDVVNRVVSAFVDGCDAAIADAVDLGIAFIDPAISGPDSPVGLLSSDRTPQPAAAAYLPRID